MGEITQIQQRPPETRLSPQSKWWTGRANLRNWGVLSDFRGCQRVSLCIQIMLIHHLDILRDYWLIDWSSYSWQAALLMMSLMREAMLIKLSPFTDHSFLSDGVVELPTLVALWISNENALLHV